MRRRPGARQKRRGSVDHGQRPGGRKSPQQRTHRHRRCRKEGAGVWQRRKGLYHALAVPLVRNFVEVGYLVVGFTINDTYAGHIKRASGAETVFLTNGSAGPEVVDGTLSKTASQELIGALRTAGGALDAAMNRGEDVAQVELVLEGTPRVASLRPLRNAEGKAVGATVVLASYSAAWAPFDAIRMQSLLAGLAALVLGALLARLAVHSTTRPLSLLAGAAEQAAQGNYEIGIPAASGDPGRIGTALELILSTIRERQALLFVSARLSRLLPEPAKSASHAKSTTQKVSLLAVEMRRFANPKLAYDPDEALSRFARDLQRISTSAGAQKGAVVAVFGHRVLATFDGENTAFRALAAATEILLTLNERDNVFDEPDPPVVALTVGQVMTGTLIWGDHATAAAAGLPMQQLESLLREATPGEIYFTRPFYDELAPLIQRAGVEVRAQRGLLSPQPLLLINSEAAGKLTGARALSETRVGLAGEGKSLTEVRAGSVVGGRFEILAELGAGRMGLVFKARDRELGDFVTLKMLRPEVVQDAVQFERLKRAVARARVIRHPNVLSVIDFGEAERIPYIESEFARGMTLAYMLEQAKALPMVAGLRIARQLAWALAAAHQQQLMHGGLKPEKRAGRGRRYGARHGLRRRHARAPRHADSESRLPGAGATRRPRTRLPRRFLQLGRCRLCQLDRSIALSRRQRRGDPSTHAQPRSRQPGQPGGRNPAGPRRYPAASVGQKSRSASTDRARAGQRTRKGQGLTLGDELADQGVVEAAFDTDAGDLA